MRSAEILVQVSVVKMQSAKSTIIIRYAPAYKDIKAILPDLALHDVIIVLIANHLNF